MAAAACPMYWVQPVAHTVKAAPSREQAALPQGMQLRVSPAARYCTQHPSPEQREWRGKGSSSWAGPGDGAAPPWSCSGRDHALAALPVGHGPAVVVGSGAFVCFFLPPLLLRLPVLPVALGVPNNGRAVVLVPGGHRKGHHNRHTALLGVKSHIPTITDPGCEGFSLRPRLLPGLPRQPRSSISHTTTVSFHTLSPSAENSYETVPKSLWELSELWELCSPRACLPQGFATWSDRTRGNGFYAEKGEI